MPQDIERRALDLIVIGAGINGVGMARDAAMRGLRVLPLDKGDISGGTTQWATRHVSGPWVDEVLAELQWPGTGENSGRFMDGTKGSHLIVDPFPGAPKGEAPYVEARKDGRRTTWLSSRASSRRCAGG